MTLGTSKALMQQRAEARQSSLLLMTSYLNAKALAETLGAINKPSSDFAPQERVAVAAAHAAAVTAFEALNAVICDQGNELGLAYLKSLLEDGS